MQMGEQFLIGLTELTTESGRRGCSPSAVDGGRGALRRVGGGAGLYFAHDGDRVALLMARQRHGQVSH